MAQVVFLRQALQHRLVEILRIDENASVDLRGGMNGASWLDHGCRNQMRVPHDEYDLIGGCRFAGNEETAGVLRDVVQNVRHSRPVDAVARSLGRVVVDELALPIDDEEVG